MIGGAERVSHLPFFRGIKRNWTTNNFLVVGGVLLETLNLEACSCRPTIASVVLFPMRHEIGNGSCGNAMAFW